MLLDVLSEPKEVRVCTAYELDGERIEHFADHRHDTVIGADHAESDQPGHHRGGKQNPDIDLEQEIDDELHRPLPDQSVLTRLKREKLRIKDEIVRLGRNGARVASSNAELH